MPLVKPARTMDKGDVADTVDDAFQTTSNIISIATRGSSLDKDLLYVQELTTGLEEVWSFQQPTLAALFLLHRLRAASETERSVDMDKIHKQIKEVRQFADVGKTGFATYVG